MLMSCHGRHVICGVVPCFPMGRKDITTRGKIEEGLAKVNDLWPRSEAWDIMFGWDILGAYVLKWLEARKGVTREMEIGEASYKKGK